MVTIKKHLTSFLSKKSFQEGRQNGKKENFIQEKRDNP
jgi:hypothetical protein